MKKIIKELWNVASKYKMREIIGLICTIFYTSSVFASTMVSKYLIDEVIVSKSSTKMLTGMIIFLLGCLGQPVFGYFKNRIFMRISEDIVRDYRVRMFEKVLKAPIQFFENNKNGEVVSRICNDGISVSDFLTNFFVVFVKNIVLIFMILVGMFLMSPMLTGIVAVLYVVYAILNYRMSREFSTLSRNCRDSYDKICVKISQSITAIDTIKSYMQESAWIDDYKEIAKKSYVNNLRVRNRNNLLNCLSTSLVVISLTIVYGIGGYMIMSGKSTVGTIAAFGLFFQNLSSPIYEFMNANIDFKKMEPIFERINEYLTLPEEYREGVILEKIDRIEFKDVSFIYQNAENMSLEHVNMEFPSHGMIALVGDSGAGKSTVIKLLNGYYGNYEGRVLINEKEMCTYETKTLRKMISIVSQDIVLMNDTIRNNILMGSISSDEQVKEICQYVNLSDVIAKLPNGYDTVINERINLSGGEKQRIAIARAIMKNSQVYIFDEPTAALDNKNEMHIKKIIENLSKEKLVIVITHNLYLLNKAKCIYTMRNGEVVERGNYQELVGRDSYFKQLIQVLNK